MIVTQLDGIGRTLAGAGAAAGALGWLDVGRSYDTSYSSSFVLDGGDFEGTGAHAGQAAYAFALVHHRDDPAHFQDVFAENGHSPASRGQGVGDGLLDEFGIVSQAAEENPLLDKVHRPQLQVCFHEETFP